MKKKFFIGLMTVLITLLVGRTSVFAEAPKPCNSGKGDLCDLQYKVAMEKVEADKAEANAKAKQAEASKAQVDAQAKEAEASKAQADAQAKEAEANKAQADAQAKEAEANKAQAEQTKLGSENTLKGKAWDTVGNNGVVGSLQAYQAILQTTGDTHAGLQYRLLSGQTGVQIDMEFPDKWPDFSADKKGKLTLLEAGGLGLVSGGLTWGAAYLAGATGETQGMLGGISFAVTSILSYLIFGR